jgi:hypothetical protein
LAVLALSKIVILCFLLRIFPNPWLRKATYIVMAFVAGSTIVMILLTIFQCTPINYNWDGWKGNFGDHQCMDLNVLIIIAAALAITQDVLILALPLPVIATLKVNWRKKAGIMFMFSLGAFVLIISCIRLQYILMFQRSTNPTWDYVDVLIWTALEVNVSIIVASLPAIRALLAKSIPKLVGSTATPTAQDRRTGRSAGRSTGVLSRTKLSSPFSTNGGATRIDDDELQLELGDRKRGLTHTEVGVAERHTDDGFSLDSDTVRIVVKTTWDLDGRPQSPSTRL